MPTSRLFAVLLLGAAIAISGCEKNKGGAQVLSASLVGATSIAITKVPPTTAAAVSGEGHAAAASTLSEVVMIDAAGNVSPVLNQHFTAHHVQ